MNALDYDVITISVPDALAIESRARPWDNQLSLFVLKELFHILVDGGILFLIFSKVAQTRIPDDTERAADLGQIRANSRDRL